MNPLKINIEAEFTSIYKNLLSFIFRLTCNKQDAEDVVQDTFISIQQNINAFKGESSFKTWVYTIAINKAKNHRKVQSKWNVNFQHKGEALHLETPDLMDKLLHTYHTKPDVDFEIKEHINYCFNCMTKTLDFPQQICLWLQDFYEFKISEIMEITGLSEGSVKHNLTYARKTLDEVFEKQCAFINKNGTCHQCNALKGILNPGQVIIQNKMELKRDKQSR
jgi:RNA polymerase sigma-70 factor, ECF subfamily